ncbi:MAG TPA: single-stranded DNA-binding protein [Bacteroidales bacterium]|nr:single-stranded DNA-binding protein [Bacteroidales bacterium]
MEKTVNKVELNGFIGIEPEMTNFNNGGKKLHFSLATNESYKNRDGEWIKETTWHNIVLWNKTAEDAEKILKKGTRVSITGKLVNRVYTDKKGNKKYISEIVANTFEAVAA